MTAVALMIALVALAARLTVYLPQAALSGILVYIAVKIFRLGEMIRIYRHGGWEILIVAASAALVVALPIETGMLLAIALSFVSSLYAVARPYCVELARVPGTTVWWPPGRDQPREHVPGVLVFATAAPLNFTNAQYLSERIKAALARAPAPVKLLVIEAGGMIAIDYTGSKILQQTIAGLKDRSIDVAIARLSDEAAMAEAEQTGLLAAIGPGRVFRSVEEAVRQLGPRIEGRAE
jgi:MFS superfamily sulfate permease-like transporter